MVSLPQPLRSEIASIRKDPYTVYPVYGGGRLRPKDETLLTRGEGKGYDIYRDLLKDAHCYAVVQKRCLAVVQREWVVEPGGTRSVDKKAADMVKAHLENLGSVLEREEQKEAVLSVAGGFDQTSEGLLRGAIVNGFAPAEILWATDGKEIYPEEVPVRSPRRFIFTPAESGGYKPRLLTPEALLDGIPLPPKKFIFHTFQAEDDNPYGWGLGSRLFWPVFFKRQLARFSLAFADKYGSPGMIGKFPASRKDIRDELLEMMQAMAQESIGVVPQGTEIDFLNAPTGGADVYEKLMNYFDREISKCVLGETGSTDQQGSGGSRARDQVGNEVRVEISKADSDLLSDTLNRTLVRWDVQFNYPDAELPKVWRRFPELDAVEDLNAKATRDNTIASMMGVKPTRKYVEKTYSIELEEPAPEEPGLDQQLQGVFGNGQENAPAAELSETADFGAIVDRILKWNGLEIGVEFLPGQVRFPGRKHSKKLRSGYGHIRRYVGADGEALDCYLYPGLLEDEPTGSDLAFQVSQLADDGDFDEHKFMLGYPSLEEARSAYLAEMPAEFFGGIEEKAIADLEQYKRPDFSEDHFFFELDRILNPEFREAKKRLCTKGFFCKRPDGTGTCISKEDTCRTAASGEPRTYREYLDKQLKGLTANNRLDEADAVLYTARKIAREKSEKTRSRLVNSLSDRLFDDEQLSALLETIKLDEGIKNPRQLAANIASLRFENLEKSGLSIASPRKDLKPLAFSSAEIDAINEADLNPSQQKAIALAKDYYAAASEMDALLTSVQNKKLSDGEYKAAYTKTEELANKLKGLTDGARAMAGKVNHPVLDGVLNRMSGISKEALPGYEIVVPSDLKKIAEKAARREC